MSSGPVPNYGGMSDYLEVAVYDYLFRGIAYTPPATLYLALFTDPAGLEENDPAYYGTELAGGGYARLAVGGATGRTFAAYADDNGPGSNAQAWDFASATADWAQVTHFALMDAATAGNVLWWGPLEPVTILSGQTFRIAAGALDIYIDYDFFQS